MYFNYLDNETQSNGEVQGQGQMESELDRLDRMVAGMLQESKEDAFTSYLLQTRQRIAAQRQQTTLLREELENNYRRYLTNQQMAQSRAQQMPQSAAQPQQAPQNMPQNTQAQQAQQMPQNTPQPQQLPQDTPQPQQRVIYQAIPTQPVPSKPKNSAEFTIGAAVLSIVGSVFILAALVLAGMNFMSGFAKGMGLYAICLLVVVLSELLLYPRWRKLGMTISALGISGLYISTLVNFLAMQNFGSWAAMGVTLCITLGVIVLSRKRDAVSYRILGMAAVYTSAVIIPASDVFKESFLTETDFLVVIAIMFLINLMCLIVPVRRARTAINITQMSLNAVFTLFTVLLGPDSEEWSEFGQIWIYPIFVAASVLVMQLIFILQVRRQTKNDPQGTMSDSVGICVAYGISTILYSATVLFVTLFYGMGDLYEMADTSMVYRLICVGVIFFLCLLPFPFLRKRPEKWASFYLLNLLSIGVYLAAENEWEIIGCLTALLVLFKLLSFKKISLLMPGDAVLTTVVSILALAQHDRLESLPLFIALLFGILCINYWKTYFEVILSFTIALYISLHMLSMLKLPVFVGILFVGILIFNNVKRWHGKGIVVYNCLMLAGQGIGFLFLIRPVYQNAFLTYLCMLIFGMATIVICFRKKYHMDFRLKHLFLAIFLTYMAVIIRTNYSVTNSILMMLVALASVGMGFAYEKKSVRIYGLILSLVVCGKVVVYDFLGATELQRMILLFAAGALALIISAIYMILEINVGKKKRKEQNKI